MKIHLLCKYVDDILMVVNSLGIGARWVDGEIKYSEDLRGEDLEGEDHHQVTLGDLHTAANTVSDFLNFTGEVSKGNEGIPVLDTHVWYGDFKGGRECYPDGKIHRTEGRKGLLYSFYSKEITNPL